MKAAIQFFIAVLTFACLTDTLEAKVLFSKKFGSENGQPFLLPKSRRAVLSVSYIKKITIMHGRRIERIQVETVNRDGSKTIHATGEKAGKTSVIYLRENEYIVAVSGRSGTLIDQLTFFTNRGRKFGPYGGTGGKPFGIKLPKGARMIGFSGRSGQAIDQFGLIYNTEPGIDKNKDKGCSNPHTREKKDKMNRSKGTVGTPNTRDHRTTYYQIDSVSNYQPSPKVRFKETFIERVVEN